MPHSYRFDLKNKTKKGEKKVVWPFPDSCGFFFAELLWLSLAVMALSQQLIGAPRFSNHMAGKVLRR